MPEIAPSLPGIAAGAGGLPFLAGLEAGWVVLPRAVIGGAGEAPVTIDIVLLHPARGIALLEAAPRWTPGAPARLRRRLALAQFAAIFPGHLPILHLPLQRDALEGLPPCLAAAFAQEAPLDLPGGDAWMAVVQRALLAPAAATGTATRRRGRMAGLAGLALTAALGAAFLLLRPAGAPEGPPRVLERLASGVVPAEAAAANLPTEAGPIAVPDPGTSGQPDRPPPVGDAEPADHAEAGPPPLPGPPPEQLAAPLPPPAPPPLTAPPPGPAPFAVAPAPIGATPTAPPAADPDPAPASRPGEALRDAAAAAAWDKAPGPDALAPLTVEVPRDATADRPSPPPQPPAPSPAAVVPGTPQAEVTPDGALAPPPPATEQAAPSAPPVEAPRNAALATPPRRPTTDPAMLAALLRRGDALLALGDVSAARRFYERAAEGGSAAGARAAGRTHDPAVLAALGVRGIRPDPAEAAAWYRRADSLAAEERP
ncbi:MAG: hypothetical protein ACOYOH_01375 [Paracraurococcus sp.]